MSTIPANRCRMCGATSYHRLFERDGGGALRHSGRYRCSGCQLAFSQASEWRGSAAPQSTGGGAGAH